MWDWKSTTVPVSITNAKESPTGKKKNVTDCQICQRVRNNKCRFSIQERVSRANRERYSWLVCKAQISVEETPKLSQEHVTIGAKRGSQPLLLSDNLDFKLRSFLTNLRSASGTIFQDMGDIWSCALPMAGSNPCIPGWVTHAEW